MIRYEYLVIPINRRWHLLELKCHGYYDADAITYSVKRNADAHTALPKPRNRYNRGA